VTALDTLPRPLALLEATRHAIRDRETAAAVRRLERAVRAVLAAQGSAFASWLRSRGDGELKAERIAGWQTVWDQIARSTAPTLEPAIRQAILSAVSTGAAWTGMTEAQARRWRFVEADGIPVEVADVFATGKGVLDRPEAVQYLTQYGAARVTQINRTTEDQLARTLAAAEEEHLSYQQAGKVVQGVTGFSRQRAQLIAVTEVGDAYEEGTLMQARALQAAGVDQVKSWLTAGDGKVDTAQCRGNAAQGWIALELPFQSGDLRPLAHPRCRCTLLTRRAEPGELGREGEEFRRFDSDDDAQLFLDGESPNWQRRLRPDELDEIGEYAEGMYSDLNGALRSGGSAPRRTLNALDSAIKKWESPENILVYRGILPRQAAPNPLRGARVGDVFEDAGYMSTSLSRRTGTAFADNEVLEIEVPKGTNAAPIGQYGRLSEQEILLPRGTRLEIVGIERNVTMFTQQWSGGVTREIKRDVIRARIV
jgi:hypothetical protein